ncbi:MAG TPA: amino acid transporter [Maritimibacter sp.]|nr:amino acid transporter [Maritimibacter sp.]
MTASDLLPIMVVWAVGVASPGPAIITLISTALGAGRRAAFGVAAGIITGSATWATAAGLGLGALMMANSWSVEVLRYLGAGYLLFLAVKSARAALRSGAREVAPTHARIGFRKGWAKGATVHIANPKAVFFWGSLFAVVIEPTAPPRDLLTVGLACLSVSATVVTLYAFAFSNAHLSALYLKARRGFETAFAGFFGFAAFSILTTRSI